VTDIIKRTTMIPLQALGVIDVGATYVGNNEVLANAIANASNTNTQNGFAIQQGSAFVNKYPRTDAAGECTHRCSENSNHMARSYPMLWLYALGCVEVQQ
jgi:hypothetical protein